MPGISLDEAYNYLKGRKSKPVIVSILDVGLDTAHEDLKDHIWTNTKEIPGNGIDDDHNGYVDDTHGWNFVANKNNEFQKDPDYVFMYLIWRKKFENIDPEKLTMLKGRSTICTCQIKKTSLSNTITLRLQER